MTSEDDRTEMEAYLAMISDLSLPELEALFMILNVGREQKYIQRNIFASNLKEFSGITLLDEKKKDDLEKIDRFLNGLCQKGYVEKKDIAAKVVLTPKALKEIEQLTRNPKFWRSFSTKRWRRVVYKENKHEGISYSEVSVIKELIRKDEIPATTLKDNHLIETRTLESLKNRDIISIDPIYGIVRRGTRFIEGLAESVRYIETRKTEESLDGWSEKIELLFNTQKQSVSRAWRERYLLAYNNAKEFDTCPLGLPPDCKDVFKKDRDSIIPTIQLSVREMNLRINIKKGFGYSDYTRHVFEGLVIELIQAKEIGNSEFIRINGTKQEMIKFFENIKAEAEKMSKETRISLESKRINEAEISSHKGEMAIHIAVLANTKREKISAISSDDLAKIIRNIKQYVEYF